MLACQASCRGFNPRLPLQFRKGTMKSFRRKDLWKILITKLNEKQSHLLNDIKNLRFKAYYYDYSEEAEFKNIDYYLNKLIQHDFIEIRVYKNQNNKDVQKVFLKCERIPRKLRPKHFEQFEQHPWLRWFMFP